LAPHLAVAEVGSGGGRVGALVAPKVQRLLCFDISEEMLKMARRSLEDLGPGDTLRIPRAGAMSRWAIYIDLSIHTHAHTLILQYAFGLFMVGLGNRKGFSNRMPLRIWILFRKLKWWEVELDECRIDRFDGHAKAFCFWVRGPRRSLQKFNCFVHEIISISVQF